MAEDPNIDSTVLLARQPIYDRRLKVHAYELLYRRDRVSGAGVVGMKESASMLVRAIVEIGLDKLVGSKPAFINIPHYLLEDPALELLPKDRVVLEILEDTPPTPENLAAVRSLSDKGYKIALDDFVLGEPLEEFLQYAKIVKVDLIGNKGRQLTSCIEMLMKKRVRVLAEKVETMQMYAKCHALGCHYFQGYFCSKPEIVAGKEVPSARANLIHTLNRLQDNSVTIDELDKLVSVDVGLTYRLLRLVNSVCIGAEEEVSTLRAALMLLGLERVASMVSLLMLAGINDKPNELLVTAMVRAKMCEGVANILGFDDAGKHFTVGLLSVLDAMFDMAMSDVLAQIPLTQDLKQALGDPKSISPLSETLHIVMAFESGQWDVMSRIYNSAPKISECYVNSVQWADQAQAACAA